MKSLAAKRAEKQMTRPKGSLGQSFRHTHPGLPCHWETENKKSDTWRRKGRIFHLVKNYSVRNFVSSFFYSGSIYRDYLSPN